MAKKATGLTANVTFLTGHNLCPDMFELTKRQQLIDATCFGSTHEEYVGGLEGGSFVVEGKPIYDDANTSPGFDSITDQPGSVTFTVAPGCTIQVNCVISNMTLRATHNADSRLSFTGMTSGPFVETWDETP
ncbi:MAG: hypothetical protein KatS3mg104_3051 [Phycisphaerae bacterium]|nr:MAG: hypothetical protein KatS3mg104_3051 [Phycisphaerae bacterium]